MTEMLEERDAQLRRPIASERQRAFSEARRLRSVAATESEGMLHATRDHIRRLLVAALTEAAYSGSSPRSPTRVEVDNSGGDAPRGG